ncbi:MAG: ribose-phosphate pyrophosphokinase [Candidatus Peribacteraceae bacterium]|nr:ribose-phosphate pyrophosphokinase [Candidatus Peribacteraceae bacterium]
MHLFAGSSHPALAHDLARELKTTLGAVTLKTFTSGECYAKYEESFRGKDVFLLQTGSQKPNEDLMELFLMCQAAQLSFATDIHVILPHFPYARQDRIAAPREPISAKLVAQLLEAAGADHVITLDLHSPQIQGFFGIPVDALEGFKIFVDYFRKKKLPDPVVVSPDAGGAKRAKRLADMLGADLALMHKSRPKHQETQVIEVVGQIAGRTCIIFDDLIDTAGSLVLTKDALLARGANKEIYAAATHAVFGGEAIKRLKKAKFKEVVVTDSIPQNPKAFPGLKILSIAPLLADVVQRIESGQSVTKIYEKWEM